jgi:hypothetical protein
LDETRKNELGEKLVWHSKGPMQSAVEFNRYVVNGMMFRTIGHDNGKRTQNSGVCVTTVDGSTYYGKLVRILEVQYYDGTRYVLFNSVNSVNSVAAAATVTPRAGLHNWYVSGVIFYFHF